MPGVRSIANGLFIPLFFASAGLHLTASLSGLSAVDIAAIVGVAVMGKGAGAVLGPRIARLTNPFAIASGVMAKGVVEIALLLAILETGAISQELFSLVTMIMLVYIFVTPLVINSAVKRAKEAKDPTMPSAIPPSYGRYALDNLKVEDVLDVSRQFPRADLSVADFMEQWIVPEQRDYVVIGDDRRFAGVFSIRSLRSVPKARWDMTSIGELAKHNYPPVNPDDSLDDVLEWMAERFLSTIPVIHEQTGAFLESITSRDVMASIAGGERDRSH